MRNASPFCIFAILLVIFVQILFSYRFLHFQPDLSLDSEVIRIHDEDSDFTFSDILSMTYIRQKQQTFVKSIDKNWNSFNPESSVYLWDVFQPEFHCKDIKRIGKVGDGGKFTCGVDYLKKLPKLHGVSSPCTIYSFGIGVEASWDSEMSNDVHCDIHLFDPSVGDIPKDYYDFILKNKTSQATFHKSALVTKHVSSEANKVQFYVGKSLVDTMLSLKHDFIDILKVDIEGGEWSVFQELFDLFPTTQGHNTPSLPFGQLLIELHYVDWSTTLEFFIGMQQRGFLIFSKEINLNPTVQGNLPLAAEFSFIHPSWYQTRRDLNFKPGTNAVLKPYMDTYLPQRTTDVTRKTKCIYFLTQHKRIFLFRDALLQFNENFNSVYRYPIVIFEDDLTDTDKDYLTSISSVKLIFHHVRFTIPSHLNQSAIPQRTTCSSTSSTIGYRHMCRFIAFHASKLLYETYGFEWTWRLDDDSRISQPIGYDVFSLLESHNKKYGFVSVLFDEASCIEGLWELSKSFWAVNKPLMSKDKLEGSETNLFDIWPEGLVFYNNFEISHVSLWTSPLYQRFTDLIEKSGGIYTHRWGDAPIHTIGVAMQLPLSSLHRFSDISYKHFPFIDQKAAGLPKPGASPFSTCSFAYTSWVCTENFFESGNSSVNSSVSTFSASNSGVIYYFLPTGDSSMIDFFQGLECNLTLGLTRDPKLPALLLDFIDSVTLLHNNVPLARIYPIFVFYDSLHSRNITSCNIAHSLSLILSNLLDKDIMKRLKFVPHTIESQESVLNEFPESPLVHSCGSVTIYQRLIYKFHAFTASDRLSREFGYSWFWRMDPTSRIENSVTYDPIARVAFAGAKYGFIATFDEPAQCTIGLHEITSKPLELSRQVKKFSGLINLMSSPEVKEGKDRLLFDNWPEGLVFYNNFEISHVSLWTSPLYQRFTDLIEKSGGIYTHRWGDAPIHTIAVAMQLSDTLGLIKLDGIEYANPPFLIGPKSSWHSWRPTASLKMFDGSEIEMHHIGQDFSVIGYRDHFGTFGVSTSQSVDVKELRIKSYEIAMSTQSVGWLGGDIAASIVVPDMSSSSKLASDKAACQKVFWLYGDSWIGIAEEEKRIRGLMISNSVAETSCSLSKPNEAAVYYWRTSSGRNPFAIFPPEVFDLERKPSIVWPIAGISIVSAVDTLDSTLLDIDIAVMAHIGAMKDEAGEEDERMFTLEHFLRGRDGKEWTGYDIMGSYLMIVSNPLNPPSWWQYKTTQLPSHVSIARESDGFVAYKTLWTSMSACNGAMYAYYESMNDPACIYIVGYVEMDDKRVSVIGKVSVAQLAIMDVSHIEIMQDVLFKSSSLWMPLSFARHKPHFMQLVDATTESTLFFDKCLLRWVIVDLPPLSGNMRMCTANKAGVSGISSSMDCWLMDILRRDDGLSFKGSPRMVYAGKSHYWLSRCDAESHSLVLSYIPACTTSSSSQLINGWCGFQQENFDTYNARFVEVLIVPRLAIDDSI